VGEAARSSAAILMTPGHSLSRTQPRTRAKSSDAPGAILWGLLVAVLTVVGIYLGSRGFKDFDAALVPYAGASVVSFFGLAYRFALWQKRPPTRMYWRRGWQLFLSPRRLPRNLWRLGSLLRDNFLAQKFIEKRSRLRWGAHFLISWGCLLAAGLTFPLSFGWVRFETARTSQHDYDAFVFGMRVFRFAVDSVLAFFVFNALNIAAFMVLGGISLAVWRRMRDRGALALQQLSSDLMPLLLLFAVSATGLLLTASTHFMKGIHYGFLSQFHAVTVIFTLLYLPFGKFFHIIQRPAQFTIAYYREIGAEGPQQRCVRCQAPFASVMHIADLKTTQAELGIAFELGAGKHYQDVCPPCRRKNLGLVQDALWRAARDRDEKGTS
jgi:hypothetical protein